MSPKIRNNFAIAAATGALALTHPLTLPVIASAFKTSPDTTVPAGDQGNWRTCTEHGAPALDMQRGNFALGRGGCVVFGDKGPTN